MLSQAITSVPGASEIFEMGIVSYSNRVKAKLLGVKEEILERYGAVSEQTAVAMAEGVLRQSGAQIGVAVTGIAGPTGGTKEKPVGTVYVSVISLMGGNKRTVVKNLELYREEKELTRDKARRLTVLKAMEMVGEICGAAYSETDGEDKNVYVQ